MNSKPASGGLEFRVLTGNQSGCRIALRSGAYRAGADDDCDLLIDGAASGAPAFVLFVGYGGVALEAVAESLSVRSRRLGGFAALEFGQVFSLGSADFCVAGADAPWPDAEEISAARLPIADVEVPDQPQPHAAAASPDDQSRPPAEPAPRQVPPVTIVPTVRRKKPFWIIWLGSTAAFLVLGLTILVVSLRPSGAAVTQPPTDAGTALQQLIVDAKDYARLDLARRPDGGWQVSGKITTRQRLTDLVRSVRAIDPDALIRVGTDEDMETLAKETLRRFGDLDVVLARVRFGEITLDGRVRQAAQRDQLCRALFDDLPGLIKIHSEVSADDDVPVTLNEFLAAQGLSGHLKGRLDGSRLLVSGYLPNGKVGNWREVRDAMEKRFGAKISIVEDFSETASAQGRPILSVLGAVPYVLLDSGELEGRGPKEAKP